MITPTELPMDSSKGLNGLSPEKRVGTNRQAHRQHSPRSAGVCAFSLSSHSNSHFVTIICWMDKPRLSCACLFSPTLTRKRTDEYGQIMLARFIKAFSITALALIVQRLVRRTLHHVGIGSPKRIFAMGTVNHRS